MKNLIGISGKIQSGKDTVGKIIQELDSNRNWQIRKFADTLKDVTCLILGCTREQLEDREFKDKELGEEWWYWKPIEEDTGDLIPYRKPTGTLPYNLIKLTPRLLLQLIGTECGRQIIHPDIWCNSTFAKYKPLMTGHIELIDFSKNTREKVSKDYPLEYPNWIITDVRFPNEADAIRKRGGIIIRVNRKHGYNTPDGKWKEMPINYHASETALDNYNFDYILENNKTVKELEEEVKKVYNKIKIL